jgi:hypothetical protein
MENKYFIRLLLFALVLLAIPVTVPTASAAGFGIGVFVGFAPPPLPVYAQPICPGEGYIWTPGYWAYAEDVGYYWVPGTWVLAPQIGFLWTPGYWGWGDGGYFWHAGYWGPHVGFYGGINYGFGYGGFGYEGGRWDHGRFFYNTRVNNVDITRIHNTYRTTVINNNTNRVSYNGGKGGINGRATSAEMAANRDRHIAATSLQAQHEQTAKGDRAQFASVNHGRPAVAATARPGEFSGRGAAASDVNASRTTGNLGRTATNNRATQNRNAGRDNAFARSQNNPNRAKGNSNVARTPTNTARQFNAQRSTNKTQDNPRHVASRPSQPAPAQRKNVTRTQSSPRAPQQHAAPSHASRPSAPQRASAPRQHSVAQRSAPQRQPGSNSRTSGGNGGNHGKR